MTEKLITDVRQAVGATEYEAIRSLVRATFPDKRCKIGNATVDAFVAGLPEEAQIALCGGKVVLEHVLGANLGRDPEVVCFYDIEAVHSRIVAPGEHSFVGHLQMVRVRLPESEGKDITTPIGIVYRGDHKLSNVDQIRQKYGKTLGYRVSRVELVTPARWPAHLGARFAAVAVYILYDTTGTPRGYILEAGMATGEPMVTFLARDRGNTITQPAWYAPTPFSDEKNWYHGRAVIDATGDLKAVDVDVRSTERGEPHLTVRASFQRTSDTTPVHAARLTAAAGLRVAAIADAMGRADLIMKLLAPFGRAQPWIHLPGSVDVKVDELEDPLTITTSTSATTTFTAPPSGAIEVSVDTPAPPVVVVTDPTATPETPTEPPQES